jgi:hypothetical protein
MVVDYEVQLVALAVALYIYDSSIFLFADEYVLAKRFGSGWRAHFGLDQFLIFGRAPYIMNLLRPDLPILRATWSHSSLDSSELRTAAQLSNGLRYIGVCACIAGVSLYFILPLGFLTSLGRPLVISGLVLMYTSLAAALALTYHRLSSLGIPKARFYSLAVECLACPPFGVNIVRRITLNTLIAENFIDLTSQFLERAEMRRAICIYIAKIDAELASNEADSDRAGMLWAARVQAAERVDIAT